MSVRPSASPRHKKRPRMAIDGFFVIMKIMKPSGRTTQGHLLIRLQLFIIPLESLHELLISEPIRHHLPLVPIELQVRTALRLVCLSRVGREELIDIAGTVGAAAAAGAGEVAGHDVGVSGMWKSTTTTCNCRGNGKGRWRMIRADQVGQYSGSDW